MSKKKTWKKPPNRPNRNIINGAEVITENENEITALRRKKDNSEVIENELREERTNLKLDLNALKERLSVEFNIDIEELPETEAPCR
jgi:chromosome segregation protein